MSPESSNGEPASAVDAAVEERVSGFRLRGSWDDVVAPGERLTGIFERLDVDEEPLEEWNDWRPKAHEHLEVEVSEKTVEQAGPSPGPGETAGQSTGADLERAGETAMESIETTDADGPADVLENSIDALEHALRATDTTSRKAPRTVETAVYGEIMTRFTACYFDNDLVSANSRRTSRQGGGEEFLFEVDVNDDARKRAVSRLLGTGTTDDGAAA